MNHVLYSLIAGHQQRRALGKMLAASPVKGTVDVDFVTLQANGIRALVFDFDGVLAPHGLIEPLPEAQTVISDALQIFGAGHVYILSNKPSTERLSWFKQYFPGIVFVGGVRKKPYPDGLERVADLGDYATSQIALLDDRLLTGGLACLNAGSEFVYISKAYTNFLKHPMKETFFAALRLLERSLARFSA